MKLFTVTTTATATEQYVVAAETEDEAKEQISKGVWESYRDLGNEDVEFINVELLLDG